MKLRHYQESAIVAIRNEWRTNRSTLLVLATGCGKTIVFCKLSEQLVREGQRILILAHRAELLDQAAEKMQIATGLACSVEKADLTAKGKFNRITVGSVQTLKNIKRLENFPRDYYDTIVIDEAHHATSPTYRAVIDYFQDARLLGVTATPDRTDKKNLGAVFQSLAYEYDLAQGIREGFLVPIKAQTIPLDINLNDCRQSAGDFNATDVDSALAPYLAEIADELVKACLGKRKTIVFLPLIATSKTMQALLNERGFRCGEVNGKSKNREEILDDFNRGEYDVLCNSMLLTEGFDEPSVDCVVCLRPTKSRPLYCQIIGRGTRLSPETGKKDLLVLDFLWHTDKHTLCHPANLIATDQIQADMITEKVEEAAKSGSSEQFSLEDMEELTRTDATEVRENALAKELAEKEGKKRRLVDPVSYGMSIASDDLAHYEPKEVHEMGLPSAKQLKLLQSHGINTDSIPNSGYASKLIDKIQMRKASGLTSAKQIKWLQQYGFQNAANWTAKQYTSMFIRTKANRWCTPNGVDPKRYNPEFKTNV